MISSHSPRLLVADVGGTNTRIAIFHGGEVQAGSLRSYRNAGIEGIDHQLWTYIRETGTTHVDGACVAGAGPVRHGAVTMTNLRDAAGAAWIIDADRVSEATGTQQVAILNDLQAQGHALGHIAASDLQTIVDGPAEEGESKLVIGLGTGVNAAPVHGNGATRLVPPSECGHISLPIRSARDLHFAQYLERLPDSDGVLRRRASVEEALAGRGLGHLYNFASLEAGRTTEASSSGVFRAMESGDEIAEIALRDYTRLLGQVLGDLALVHLPFGGLYLIGGMARAIAPYAQRFQLDQHFRAPRWINLLDNAFRVSVVGDDAAALTGCAAYMTAQLED